jgi:hypothetical protein
MPATFDRELRCILTRGSRIGESAATKIPAGATE